MVSKPFGNVAVHAVHADDIESLHEGSERGPARALGSKPLYFIRVLHCVATQCVYLMKQSSWRSFLRWLQACEAERADTNEAPMTMYNSLWSESPDVDACMGAG